MTKFEKVKRYINKQEIGSVVTRQKLLQINNEQKRTDATTTDNYRKIFTKLGFLEATEKPGHFIVKEHIPPKLQLLTANVILSSPEKLIRRNKTWFSKLFTQ